MSVSAVPLCIKNAGERRTEIAYGEWHGSGPQTGVTRVIVALAAACLLAACTALAPRPDPAADAVVYVIGRDWHTDIGLPVDEIAGPLAEVERPFPGVRVLTFGFGDRRFLLTRDRSPLSMLAALLPGRGALLITALGTDPAPAFGAAHVVRLHISADELSRLRARLWREFEHTTGNQPVLLAEGPYPGSLFYAASATYSGLYTCNTWTADVARAGGLAMPAAGVLFAGQVMGPARWLASRQALLHRP
nr:DUF2459 domain-containing protein [uncultured Rhodopila sp.]